MYWKIPNIPDKKTPSPPKYKKLILSYIIFISLIYLYITKFIDKEKTELIIYPLCIISIVFLIIIGFIFIRSQREIIIVDNWDKEKETIKMKWKNWCQSSVNLIGNVIYTPDKEGAGVFFMDAESIPMYPSKPRNLFNKLKVDKNLLLDINKKLKEQSIDYTYFLSKIYLITENNFSYLSDIVYQQWDLLPIKATNYSDIFSSENKNETYLILTVQSESEFSHFVSAQLFSNEEKLINNSSKKISIERVMEFKNTDFDKEIRKYIEYSGISKREKFQTWVSKNNQEGIEDIIIAYSENNVYFDKKRPIWMLENYYSKPYKHSFLTYLSLVSEVSDISKQDQVLIHFNTDNSGYAIYVKNR